MYFNALYLQENTPLGSRRVLYIKTRSFQVVKYSKKKAIIVDYPTEEYQKTYQLKQTI